VDSSLEEGGFELFVPLRISAFFELVEPCAERRPRREPGTRIAAVGADKGGDQELDPENLQRARIFVDDIRQYRTAGEINVPLCQGRV
jgi:ornithine cyclodeaminase/alanine dehydrogenase-like protein (mu-crystallin family)